MDIFIIETKDSKNFDINLLKEFRKKEFKNECKFLEHCFSYLMVDRILSNLYDISNREIEFLSGKPFLKTREKYFSISHSEEYIALAFSDKDCGIDIEKIKERDFSSISKRMGFKSDSKEDFYYEWTKYESEFKLSSPQKYTKQFKYEDYVISASTEYQQEKFELYIQNGNNFSNVQI